MFSKKVKARLFKILFLGLLALVSFIIYAYSRTWGKTEIEFRIHINEEEILRSVYGESPTFAIWIQNSETAVIRTIFVTSRAGLDDWEGKADIPTALPKWESMSSKEKGGEESNTEIDAVTGATPLPGYFTTRVRVSPESKWICWIEMNLAGDYNEHYPEQDEISKEADEFGTGQPAIVYKADIKAVIGNTAIPEIVGMSILNGQEEILQPLNGITTAQNIFDEILISVVRPKPKVL